MNSQGPAGSADNDRTDLIDGELPVDEFDAVDAAHIGGMIVASPLMI
jgi:hypothetical protein